MYRLLFESPRPQARPGFGPHVLGVLLCCVVLTTSAADTGGNDAVVSSANASVAAASPASEESRRHRHRDDHRRGHVDPRSGVNVYVAPQSERFPGNYVPDNYRLDSYDGRPDRPTLCRGESGRTLSTRDVPCPPGQRPETGGRTWSTTP